MLLDALVHIHDRRIAQSAASTATMQIQVLVAIFFLCPTTSRVSSESLVLLLLLLLCCGWSWQWAHLVSPWTHKHTRNDQANARKSVVETTGQEHGAGQVTC